MSGTDLMRAPWQGPVPHAAPVSAHELQLTDLSYRRRFGLKGQKALDWLCAQGQPVPVDDNCAATSGGLLVARLAPGEAILLAVGEGSGALVDDFRKRLAKEQPAGCYGVPRQDMSAWFRLSGAQAPAFMAQLCAVDLRPQHFALNRIAQTSVSHQNAVVIRGERGGAVGYDLLVDFAGAQSFWKALADGLMQSIDD